MIARQHHYIPQCYLKGFVNDRKKPKLFVVDCKERRSFSAVPAKVAVQRDFHRIDAEDHPPDALERIRSSRSIKDQNDRALLFNLMALIAIKNPRHRENTRSAVEQLTKRVMDLATATPERWASQVRHLKAEGVIENEADTDYRKMRDFVEADRYKIEITTPWHLELELKNSFEAVLPFFFGRKWILFRAPPNTTSFVTSDHPVCLMWSDPARRSGFRQPGHGLRGTQIVFPISQEMAIIGAFEAHDDEMDASESLVAQINGSIILHADRQIYSRDDQFPYIMQDNEKIMRGAELLNDQCRTPSTP